MNVKTTYSLLNDTYTVKLETLNFSSTDLDLISKFGEPSVELGGTFTYNTNHTFILPTKQALVRSQFPQLQAFDGIAFNDAEDRANAWATEMLSRVTTAMTTLREQADNFSRTTMASV